MPQWSKYGHKGTKLAWVDVANFSWAKLWKSESCPSHPPKKYFRRLRIVRSNIGAGVSALHIVAADVV